MSSINKRNEVSVFIGIILISFVYVFFLIPNKLLLEGTFQTRINLMLTLIIGFFAMIEGYSTYKQWNDSENNRKSDLVREQLEKVFGPLRSQLAFND